MGQSEDPTEAWFGKMIMFENPNTYDVGYKVMLPMETTVYGLTGQYDAGAKLSWRVIGGDGKWYDNECYAHNGNYRSSCNVPSDHGVRGKEFEVKLHTHHSSWNWFGALSFVCSPMPEGAATRWEAQHHDDNHDDDDDDDEDPVCEAARAITHKDESGEEDSGLYTAQCYHVDTRANTEDPTKWIFKKGTGSCSVCKEPLKVSFGAMCDNKNRDCKHCQGVIDAYKDC